MPCLPHCGMKPLQPVCLETHRACSFWVLRCWSFALDFDVPVHASEQRAGYVQVHRFTHLNYVKTMLLIVFYTNGVLRVEGEQGYCEQCREGPEHLSRCRKKHYSIVGSSARLSYTKLFSTEELQKRGPPTPQCYRHETTTKAHNQTNQVYFQCLSA
jgi:hypothetical protein